MTEQVTQEEMEKVIEEVLKERDRLICPANYFGPRDKHITQALLDQFEIRRKEK